MQQHKIAHNVSKCIKGEPKAAHLDLDGVLVAVADFDADLLGVLDFDGDLLGVGDRVDVRVMEDVRVFDRDTLADFDTEIVDVLVLLGVALGDGTFVPDAVREIEMLLLADFDGVLLLLADLLGDLDTDAVRETEGVDDNDFVGVGGGVSVLVNETDAVDVFEVEGVSEVDLVAVCDAGEVGVAVGVRVWEAGDGLAVTEGNVPSPEQEEPSHS